jgi:hypothetical protein
MELTLGGLIGAVIGTVLGAVNYAAIVSYVEKRLRALDTSQTAQEREEFERKVWLMRRIVLGVSIFALGGLGYWFGTSLAGTR